MQQNYKK